MEDDWLRVVGVQIEIGERMFKLISLVYDFQKTVEVKLKMVDMMEIELTIFTQISI